MSKVTSPSFKRIAYNYVTGFDKTRLPHTPRFVTLKDHNLKRNKLSLSNFDLLLHNAMNMHEAIMFQN